MDSIIEALTAFASTPWMDYLLTAASLLISVVAVGISVSTAKKQNRIAVFEKRYICISQIKTLLSFESSTYEVDETILIQCLYDALWGTNISSDIGYDEKILKSRCHAELLSRDILQAKYLFKGKLKTDLGAMLKCLHNVVMASINCKFDEDSREKLHQYCAELSEVDLPKLEKQIDCRKI